MLNPLAKFHCRFLLSRDDWGSQVNPLMSSQHNIFIPSIRERGLRNRDVTDASGYLASSMFKACKERARLGHARSVCSRFMVNENSIKGLAPGVNGEQGKKILTSCYPCYLNLFLYL